jgi:hypothetical protein
MKIDYNNAVRVFNQSLTTGERRALRAANLDLKYFKTVCQSWPPEGLLQTLTRRADCPSPLIPSSLEDFFPKVVPLRRLPQGVLSDAPTRARWPLTAAGSQRRLCSAYERGSAGLAGAQTHARGRWSGFAANARPRKHRAAVNGCGG